MDETTEQTPTSTATHPAGPACAPAVSVIVPCCNEAAHIEECLRAILNQEPLPDGGTFEVLVAEGRSDDGTREKVQALAAADPRVVLIDNPERIVSTGLNAAIRAARADVIVRMDAHTTYAPDYLRQCVAVLEETGAQNVGGPICTRAVGYLQRAVAAAYHSPFSVGGARSHNTEYEGPLDSVVYGCWKKQTLLDVGLFDEELVRNQDDELNFRIARAGGTIWQSRRIKSWYSPRSSLRSLFRQYFQYGYWKVRVIQKHGRPASLRHLAPALFALGLLVGLGLGFVHWGFWLADALALGSYLALSLAFSARAAAQNGWDLFPVLPLVFLMYHYGYGSGFALGFIDFVLLHKGGRQALRALSRPSAAGKT